MKRKILVLLLCVLSLTLAVVLASCESVGIIVTNPVDLVRDTNSAQSDKTPISTAEQSASQQTAQVHEHKYNSRVVKEPTCDEGGQIEYYCDCGERYREETNQLNHILSIQNVSWSLEYEATARLRCTLCGAEFYVSCNVVEYVGAEPTCDADGSKIYYASIDIRDSEGLPSNVEDVPLPEVSVKETLPAFGHEFEEEWVVLSEATCTEEGEAVRYCKHDRNHVQTQILLPSGHNYVVDEVVEPTCYEDGYILYRCELCQDYYTIDTHTSHEYEVTSFVAATCEENGYITYTCNNCNDRYSEVIPKGNHNYVVEVVTPATKEQEGLKHYTCTNCGDSYDETIPQIGEGSLVLMVQDSMPWTYSGDNALLNELQRDGLISSWNQVTSSQLSSMSYAELSTYSVIFIAADDQSSSTYSTLLQSNSELDLYVNNGGVVVYLACYSGWAGGYINGSIINGVTTGVNYSGYNYIKDAFHPIITGELTDYVALDGSLLNGNYCSHVYFENLPEGAVTILVDGKNNSTLVEYEYGEGTVILSGLTWEFYYYGANGNGNTYSTRAFDDLIAYAIASAESGHCDHEYILNQVVDATCGKEGYTEFVCSNCGRTYKKDFTEALEHEFELFEEVEPTCESDGYIKYACIYCGDTIREEEEALGHNYLVTEQVPATPDAEGHITYECSRCGEVYTETIIYKALTGRILVVQYNDPWDEDNNNKVLSNLVSNGYISDFDIIGPNSFGQTDLSGYDVILIESSDASGSSATISQLYSYTSKLEDYVSNGGVLIYSCASQGSYGSYSFAGSSARTLYGSSTQNKINDSTHPIVTGELTDGTPLTYSILSGSSASHNYFDSLPEGTNIILIDSDNRATLVEYQYGNGTVILSGLTFGYYYSHNYTTGGSGYFAPTIYDDLFVYAVGLVGTKHDHEYVLIDTVEPTCTQDGYKVYKCSICGRTKQEKTDDSLGHNYVQTSRVEATCYEYGYIEYTCSRCDDSYTTSIDRLSHNYVLSQSIEATCTQNGSLTYTCTLCGNSYTNSTSSLGHDYNLSQSIEATCTQNGSLIYVCSRCGNTYTDTTDKLAHSYVETERVEATADAEGHVTYTCSKCGDSYTKTLKIKNSSTRVLVVQDSDPWGYSANSKVLNRLQNNEYIEGYDIISSTSFSSYDLSDYGVILVESSSSSGSSASVSNLYSYTSQLEEFVSDGGTIIYSCASSGSYNTYKFAGSNAVTIKVTSNQNSINDEDHPIVTGELTDGTPLTYSILSGSSASHNYFDSLPEGTNIILIDSNGRATLAEYQYGNGTVILSGLTFGYYYSDNYTTGGKGYFAPTAYDDVIVYAMSLVAPSHVHDFVLTEKVDVTCENDGFEKYTCSICGKVELRNEVEALGHNYGDWVIVTEPTEESNGLKRRVCQNNPEHIVEVVLYFNGSNLDVWDGTASDGFESGSGTVDDPYVISTAEQLACLSNSVNNGQSYQGKYFVLDADLDLDNIEWNPIGQGSRGNYYASNNGSNTAFKGTFNGNGHIISNLKVTGGNTSFSGLFGAVVDGTITSLGVENATIKAYSSNGSDRMYVGVIAASISNTTIEKCYVTNAYVENLSKGICDAALLVGNMNKNSVVENCYAIGEAKGSAVASGLVGTIYSTSGTIRNSYAVVTATATGGASGSSANGKAGGICPYIESGSVYNCVVDATLSGGEVQYMIAPNNYHYNCSTDINNLLSSSYVFETLQWDDEVWNVFGETLPQLRVFDVVQ